MKNILELISCVMSTYKKESNKDIFYINNIKFSLHSWKHLTTFYFVFLELSNSMVCTVLFQNLWNSPSDHEFDCALEGFLQYIVE